MGVFVGHYTVFTELANIVVVIVTNPMFILSWVHEKFTVKFTMSNVDGCAIYMHIGHLNCPEYVLSEVLRPNIPYTK